MTVEQLRFVHPELLLLLAALVPLAALYLLTFAARRRSLARFAGPGAALVSRSSGAQVARAILTLVAAAAVVAAAAGPFIEEREVEVRWRGVDLVVALDVSQSMGTQDVQPDRLRLARRAIESLTGQLSGSRVALVLFGGSGVVRYPATTDPRVVAQTLDATGRGFRPTAGSSLKAALDSAFDAFPQDSALPKAVLLVSDGEDTTAVEADVGRFRARNIRIFAFAVGTAGGGQVPAYDNAGRSLGPLLGPGGQPVVSRMREDLLAQLAQRGGGRVWRYDGGESPIRELATELQSMGTGELGGATQKAPDDRYQLFAGLALIALLVEWVTSERRAMPRPRRARVRAPRRSLLAGAMLAILLAACGDAAATNETANGLFASGDFTGALERYRALLRERPDMPELSINAGNALYRLGEFARAVPNYEAAGSAQDRKVRAIALYDKGDAFFRLRQLPEAREAYIAALRLDPSDRDAKFNIEVIDRLLAIQQLQQQQRQGAPSGQQQQPGASQPGQPGSPQGQDPNRPGQQPGQPGTTADRNQPGGEGQESVEEALLEFRENLTPEEAFRLLDALMRQQRGIQVLLEGGPRRQQGQEPQY